MRPRRRGLTPVSLLDTYAYLGEFSVKLLLDHDLSLRTESVSVEVRNSDGKPMQSSFKRWGTKLNIDFTIDEQTPDGVSIIDITMTHPRLSPAQTTERLSFWVVKP